MDESSLSHSGHKEEELRHWPAQLINVCFAHLKIKISIIVWSCFEWNTEFLHWTMASDKCWDSWGCPVQGQDLASMILLCHSQFRIFCNSVILHLWAKCHKVSEFLSVGRVIANNWLQMSEWMRVDLHKSALNSFANYSQFLTMKIHFSTRGMYALPKRKVIPSSSRPNLGEIFAEGKSPLIFYCTLAQWFHWSLILQSLLLPPCSSETIVWLGAIQMFKEHRTGCFYLLLLH